MATPDREVRRLRVEPSAEFERMLSNILTGSAETIKEVERIIGSPDSETKLNYEVQVDPRTGKQKVIEKFTTTKKECAICGGYFAQIFVSEYCKAQVCANDSRFHEFSYDLEEIEAFRRHGVTKPPAGIMRCRICHARAYPNEADSSNRLTSKD